MSSTLDNTRVILPLSATCALMGVVFLAIALRRRAGSEPASAYPVYLFAATGFAIAALVWLRAIAPIIGYDVLCVTPAGFYLADLLEDERERRRRVALLAPRPPVEMVPAIWIGVTALATTAPLLWFVLGSAGRVQELIAQALITWLCALAIVAIAWRIASAPMQLTGEDPHAEQLRERVLRARKAAISCAVALGIVNAFITVAMQTTVLAGADAEKWILQALWFGLIIWQFLYTYLISRSAPKACS